MRLRDLMTSVVIRDVASVTIKRQRCTPRERGGVITTLRPTRVDRTSEIRRLIIITIIVITSRGGLERVAPPARATFEIK